MGPCIAVVEDEPPVLEMLCDLLEEGGFSVVPFDRPDLTRTMDEGVRPALFLIDLMLPGKSGFDLAKQLRRQGFSDTPMIAMSASRTMARFAAESGLFQETLYKPFDLSALMNCVERYLALQGAG